MPNYDSWITAHLNASGDFDDAVSRLESLGGNIQHKVGETIHDELDHLTELAKSRLTGEPVHGSKQTGLRARIAAGTEVVPTNEGYQIQVMVDDADMGPIPWGLDTKSKGWKHPVFGRKPWVRQKGTAPWWSDTVAQAQPDLEIKLPEKIDEAIRETFGD